MMTVVLWKWGQKFSAGHVKRMQSMLARQLQTPHRIVCITDKPKELPTGVTPAPMVPILPGDYKGLRRMWLYSADARKLGDRLLQLDLDVVLTDCIDPLVDRPEPFVIWRSESANTPHKWAYNATVMLITPGAQDDIWRRYKADPKGVMAAAEAGGWNGKVNSDQAAASFLLTEKGESVPHWTDADGILSYRVFAGKHGDRGEVLPPGARIVSFHGPRDPSLADLQQKSPWILDHWR